MVWDALFVRGALLARRPGPGEGVGACPRGGIAGRQIARLPTGRQTLNAFASITYFRVWETCTFRVGTAAIARPRIAYRAVTRAIVVTKALNTYVWRHGAISAALQKTKTAFDVTRAVITRHVTVFSGGARRTATAARRRVVVRDTLATATVEASHTKAIPGRLVADPVFATLRVELTCETLPCSCVAGLRSARIQIDSTIAGHVGVGCVHVAGAHIAWKRSK